MRFSALHVHVHQMELISNAVSTNNDKLTLFHERFLTKIGIVLKNKVEKMTDIVK